MVAYRRYAIYYTPPEGGFADFGASWLGWDVISGCEVAHPDVLVLDVEKITRTPRKYGFHATLKPPFRLADGHGEAELRDAAAALAEVLRPVTLPGLSLNRIGSFLALTPDGDMADLNRLAAQIVESLDPLRAPLNEAEIARRNPDALTERQRDYLRGWGYPYVKDEFRFHMTLSGSLDEPIIEATRSVLEPMLDVVPRPFVLDAISLMGEGEDGRFRLIERLPL
ncbi:DUF1045 domain-containing protein [Paracoccus sp. SCSIO 75233]|uniref:DUF1045 domain-containing protein n=1 Tax=Paracoccus sp. SCSIO 75233 TaxID=3017782 RepID=UPI0022EFF981|nr:DUF1045 domain-containing protein [Paracoccus sp. SCSIO 75233]WBU54822.1 DUF1045 domain-containing protein [Paracoccus sp. SCSIO 75233]